MSSTEFEELASDFIIDTVHEYEQFTFESVLEKFDYKKHKTNITSNQEVMLSLYKSDETLKYMMAKGFIYEANMGSYRLTDFGREVKTHKGYKNYLSFIGKRNSAIIETAIYTKKTAASSKSTAIANWVYVTITLGIFLIGLSTCHNNSSPSNKTEPLKHDTTRDKLHK